MKESLYIRTDIRCWQVLTAFSMKKYQEAGYHHQKKKQKSNGKCPWLVGCLDQVREGLVLCDYWYLTPISQCSGAYDVSLRQPPGGRLSTSKVPSDVELATQRAKHQPGPGSYDVNHCPLLRPIGSPIGGGKISQSQIKSDIECRIQRAKQQPGPLDYRPDDHVRVLGGRIGSGSIKSYLDLAMHRASESPGPGEYHRHLFSIGWRYGGIQHAASVPSRPVVRRVLTIPPEARCKPRPSAAAPAAQPDSQAHRPDGDRSSCEPGGGSGSGPGRSSLPLPLRALSVSPTSWVLPQSAAAAYGVHASSDSDKPRRRRSLCNLRVEVGRVRTRPSAFDPCRSPTARQSQVRVRPSHCPSHRPSHPGLHC
jgi:hypothetical protein